jgi:F-type H+-transporting ATPase subunit delta
MFAKISIKPSFSKKNISFVQSRKFATEAPAAKTSINFVLACPHETVFSKDKAKVVKNIRVPGVTGEFGVTPGTVPTIAELRPGKVKVQC